MFERTLGMQAMTKQAEVLAWARDDQRAAQAERGRQERQGSNRRSWRETIAALLVTLATRLAPHAATGI